MDIEMSVSVRDKVIVVDGEGYTLGEEFPAIDDNLRGLQWSSKRQGRCKGTAQYHTGGAEGFNEWERAAPFYAAWEKRREAGPREVPTQSNIIPLPVAADDPLPRFLNPSPSVAPEMLEKLADFEKRVDEVQRQAVVHLPEDQSGRIAELEARQAKTEAVLEALLAEFRKLGREE